MTSIKIGQKSLDICKYIVERNPVESVKIIKHDVGLNWSQKYSNDEERRKNFLDSYKDANTTKEDYILSKKEFLDLDLEKTSKKLNKNEVLSMTSKLKTNNDNYLHIPMMNFHPENNFGLDEILKSIEHTLPNKKGVLLDSGRYFHYYGTNFLLNQKEWEDFLGNFLIPFNLVHPGYIGYRLKEGYSTLRLTKHKIYKPKFPEVIKIIE